MKRRTFCAAGFSALAAAGLPRRRTVAATAGADVAAVGMDHRTLSIKASDLAQLRASVRGEVITADQGNYDAARRLWNAAFDKKPAVIVRCAGAADIMQSVSFAAAHGILTAVRGGGHSYSGQSGCDGGLVIDVSPMRAVRVDPVAKLAYVESGTLLGVVDRETQAFGLALPLGTVADTGVAGLTLGGGQGRLGKRLGLTIDNLAAVDLVTADGHWLRASADENPDLYWALRGGGGNFGVATNFTYRLHEVAPAMFGGTLSFAFSGARKLLRAYADICESAPDDLHLGAAVTLGDNNDRVVEVEAMYSGPLADAPRVLTPLKKLGRPLKGELGPTPYLEIQQSLNAPGLSPYGVYLKGGLIYGLSPTLIDSIVDYVEANPSQSFDVQLYTLGGAIGRVPPQDTAYWGRGASHAILLATFWKVPGDGAESNASWVKNAWAKLEPYTRGSYLNLAGAEDRNRVHAGYGGNYSRLATIKKRYDPANLFRLNANIVPVG
ncbi:MAG TPA: FAD-binding oxidoreductase [Rhizomicrobium sp.]|jgi:FAD/FMN-containing dehydrogenase|nr:FAD-binding oxidoreductase [Rhizomicrobium sp.]